MAIAWGLCCLDKKIAGNKEIISNIINIKSEIVTDVVTEPFLFLDWNWYFGGGLNGGGKNGCKNKWAEASEHHSKPLQGWKKIGSRFLE